MSFRHSLALAAIAMAALVSTFTVQARSLALTAEQADALGIRFARPDSAAKLEFGVTARVVIRPDAQYLVAAPYQGMVSQLLVAIGQRVRKGQALAAFASPQMFEAGRALAEARSQLELAQLAVKRDRQLKDDGIIAANRWEATQARAREAAAMVRAREAELASAGVAAGADGSLRLVAGIDGLIAQIHAVPGTRIDASAPLFLIVDPTALELDILVGRDMPAVASGESVEIPQRGASGTVAGVVPVSDGTGAVRIRANIQQRGTLQAGEDVAAVIHLNASAGRQGASTIRVPVGALAYLQGKPGIFVLSKEGVVYQPVTLEATDGSLATVSGAIPADAQVAVQGVGALKGMLVGEK